MSLWIAFFRGINVGGHNALPMKALKDALEEMGCEAVSSYIQSGNVVFSNPATDAVELGASITATVLKNFGFEPRVLLMTKEQLIAAHRKNPFPAGVDEPKTLHLFFLASEATEVDYDALDASKSDTEKFELLDHVFYLHAPDGIGRSKLAARIEKCLGVPTTARNWRTVEKVLQLATNSK